MSALAVIVHGVLAGSAAVATVNATLASFYPVMAAATPVNVLVLHPCFVGAVPEARVHVGSAKSIVLLVSGKLEHWNVSTKVPEAPAMGLKTTNNVQENAATAVTVDVMLAVHSRRAGSSACWCSQQS